MKYIKMLGLLAVAAAALMAFVGPASAASVTSNEGTTPTIKATGTNTKLHGAFVTVECANSSVEGKTETHGAGVPVGGKISALTFTGCNYATTVVSAGSLAVHALTPTGNGTVTSSGAKITIHTSIGICTFTTNNTDIGTLTGSANTKGKAVLDINSAKIPRTEGNFLCGTSGTWTGNYTVNSPSTLDIH